MMEVENSSALRFNWGVRHERAALLGVLGVGALALAFYVLTCGREPLYQGKELSQWMLVGGKDQKSIGAELERVRAIWAIGSNAVPYLVRWGRYWPGPWQKAVRRAAPGLGFLREQEDLANATVEAFRIIGPEAASAIPELTRTMQSTNFVLANRARWSVLAIEGREFRIPLQERGFHPRYGGRGLGLDGEVGVQILVRSLQDTAPGAAEGAAIALGGIGSEPGVVKALTNAFETADSDVRLCVVSALGRFGADSIPAVPCLVRGLSDSAIRVREAATNSLRRLAMETMGTVRAP